MTDKHILLAGASGMVGRAVLKTILGRTPGAKIRAVRFQNDSLLEDNSSVEWVKADLLSREECGKVAAGCDSVVMAAASTFGSRGMADEPWKALNDNVIINTQLLEACHFEGVRRVVFIGTTSVYQDFDGAIKEDELDWNQDPHPAHMGVGWAMRFVEKLCRFWYEKSGMEAVIVRAANVFGPYASFDPGKSNVIPALIRKSVEKMDPFEVWGSPDVVRDVVYSADFADAVICLLEAHQIKFDVFNVGSGRRTTVGEMVNCALKAAGYTPSEIRYVSGAPETVRVRRLDCSKIRDAVGWVPKHRVEDGIRKTTMWWQENRHEWKK